MINEDQLIFGFLIFLRVVGFVFTMAFWGAYLFTNQVKILFSVALTIIIYLILSSQKLNYVITEHLFIHSLLQIFMGIFLGFITRFLIFSINIVGEWVGVSSGSSFGQIFNPSFGESMNIFDYFYFVLLGLIFFSMNAHHVLLYGLVKSFDFFPPNEINLSFLNYNYIFESFKSTIIYGFKIALPVIASIFIVNLVMGVLARVTPQLNIFVTSLQIMFIATLSVIFISMPLIFTELKNSIDEILSIFLAVVKGVN